MTNYIVGAYAASPCLQEWQPHKEEKFLSALRAMPTIRGLEIPFYDHLHRFDESFLLDNLLPTWSHLITMIPGTIERFEKYPVFGLASVDSVGRQRALDYLEQARQSVLHLNKTMNRKTVLGVEIHSAPQQRVDKKMSSVKDFSASLSECSSWDWDGATLLVEHCDAFIPSQIPVKGFLSLEEEIQAIKSVGRSKTPLGVLINWARSAIEGRNALRAQEHVEFAQKSGLLKAIIFSGCAHIDEYHGGWQDSHAPFAKKDAQLFGVEGSLLTQDRASECLQIADSKNLLAVGFKIQPLPTDRTIDERIGLVEESLRVLDASVYQRN